MKAEFNGDDLQPLMRELYYAEKEYLENLLKQEVLSSDMRAIIDATFHSFILGTFFFILFIYFFLNFLFALSHS